MVDNPKWKRRRTEAAITGRTRKRATILETLRQETLILSGLSGILDNEISPSSLHQFSPISRGFLRTDV